MGEGLGLGAVDPQAPAAHEFDADASDAEEREQAIEPRQLASELPTLFLWLPTRLLCHRLRRLPSGCLGSICLNCCCLASTGLLFAAAAFSAFSLCSWTRN